MNNYILLSFFFIVFTLSSCDKELEPDLSNNSSFIVMNSLLFQDSTISTQIYHTSDINENHNNLWYIDTAIVSIYKDGSFIENLEPGLQGKYSGEHRVLSGATYQFNIDVPNLKQAMAKVEIPSKVDIIKLDSFGAFIDSDTYEKYYDFAFCFKDKGDTKDYYMVDFAESALPGTESSDIYSNDPAVEVENVSYLSGEIYRNNSYFLTDELFNGMEYSFSICVPQNKVFEGFTINLSHITSDYFKYAKTLKAQNESKGLSVFFQTVQVFSNIENGLGILGAASTSTRKYQFAYISN